MKRVLLASSNINREPYPVYPLGMAIVAAALADGGHIVEQYDFLASGESSFMTGSAVVVDGGFGSGLPRAE